MLNSIKKVAGVSLTAGMVLAATANDATAYDFTFSGYNSGNLSLSGTFRIKDSSLPSTDLNQSDFLDWEISISNSSLSSTTTFYGDGNGFGTDNSDIVLFPTGISADFSTMSFQNSSSGGLCIDSNSSCSIGDGFLRVSNNYVNFGDGNSSAFFVQNADGNAFLTASASSPTAVPFGVSTDLSLLILGGLYGASRLRKKLAK